MKIVKSSGSEIIEIELDKNLFKPNEEMSRKNRELLDQHGVHAVDILGSIGSGKTSIVQQIIKHIGKQVNMAAIAGDLTTTIDADRIRESGGFVVQANTGKSCHLNSNLVKRALDELDLENLDVVLIENVGNLICPADFPVGAHQRIVVVSTTEGPYMVIKHPYILMQASVLIVNKIDMAAAMEVDIQQIKMDALKIKSSIKVVFTSAKTGEGIPELIEALNFPKV
jgi:hydrogenase nickel incorporation protein HypB